MTNLVADARRPPDIAIALAIAVAAHTLLLFGIALPASAPSEHILRVTLTSTPTPRRMPTDTLATADQTGTDADSRRNRAAPLPNGSDTAARSRTDHPGNADNAAAPVIARRPDSRPQAARVGGREQAGGSLESAENPNDDKTRSRSATADLRAAYLEAWRRDVERIGNRNFPARALSRNSEARLTLQVTLSADGRLLATRIRRSSGNPELDAAARRILRTAAPFAAFPPALREQSRQLTFAYEWRFQAGADTTEIGDPGND